MKKGEIIQFRGIGKYKIVRKLSVPKKVDWIVKERFSSTKQYFERLVVSGGKLYLETEGEGDIEEGTYINMYQITGRI